MTQSPARLVREFHKKLRLHDDRPLRIHLIQEEVGEYLEAESHDDTGSIARELADIVYAAYGTAHVYGIDLDEAIAEVHRANMTRLSPSGSYVTNDQGKVLKGSAYRPPDMARATRKAHLHSSPVGPSAAPTQTSAVTPPDTDTVAGAETPAAHREEATS